MGSANNWLGFSLSPNVAVELQDERQAQQEGIGLGINTTSSDWMPSSSQNSFFILDSIHRSSQPHHVEWQQNTHCGSMDLSMIVGGGNRRVKEEQAPKLEDFLGGASRHYSSGRNVDAEVPSSMEGSFYGATAFNNSNNSNGNHHHPPAPQNIVSFNGFDMADSHLSATAKRSQDNTCEMNAHAWHALGHHQQQQQQQHHIGPECSNLGVAVAGPQHNAINATGLSFLKTWFTPTDTKPIQNTLSNNADININEDGFNYGGPASCSTITSASNPTADNANINVETHRQPQQPVAAQQGNELNVIQSLSLSMSSNSQSTTSLALPNVQQQPAKSNNSVETSSLSGESKKRAGAEAAADCKAMTSESNVRKSIDTFGQRTSVYRGVTRHRWTGRYEAHLWDNSCRREGQTRKGRQVYLGGYDKEEKAARAYDLAALKYWGPTTTTNFPISNYEKELEEMKHMTRQEYVASLRRKSSGFSRGASIYRGVTRHHQHGRWQARIGRVAGNKDLYLGTFSTQEEAAEAYDIAAIKFRGLNAVTNFDMSRYDVKSILASSTLPLANHVKRIRDADSSSEMPLPLPLPSFNHNYSKSLLQHQHHNPQTDAEANKWPALLALHQHRQQKQQQPWYKQEQTHFATSSHPFHTNNCNNNNNPGILHNLNIMGVGMNVYQDSASAMDMQMMDDNMMIMEPMPVQETLPSSNNNTNHQMKVCVSSAFGDHSSSPASFCNLNMNMYSYDAFPKTTPIAAGEVGAHRGRGRIAPGGLYYANADTDGGGSGSAVANDNENDGNWTNAGNVRSSNGLAQCQATPIFSIWNDS